MVENSGMSIERKDSKKKTKKWQWNKQISNTQWSVLKHKLRLCILFYLTPSNVKHSFVFFFIPFTISLMPLPPIRLCASLALCVNRSSAIRILTFGYTDIVEIYTINIHFNTHVNRPLRSPSTVILCFKICCHYSSVFHSIAFFYFCLVAFDSFILIFSFPFCFALEIDCDKEIHIYTRIKCNKYIRAWGNFRNMCDTLF